MAELPQRVARWLPLAKAAGGLFGIDPLLMMSICDRESRGDPNAQSRDGGMGLYQITERYHRTFCQTVGPDGRLLVWEPKWNTLYAAALLAFNVSIFDGVVPEPLIPATAAFNASHKRVREAIRRLSQPCTNEQLIAALDPLTTPSKPKGRGDYVSAVWSNFKSYATQ